MKNSTMEKVLIAQKRKKEIAEQKAEALMSQAFSNPEISQAHSNYVNAMFSYYAKPQASSNKVLDELHKLYAKKLAENGYSESDFEIKTNCKICNDTGFIDGKVCRCIWKEYILQLEQDCNILKTAPFTFESCNFCKIDNKQQRTELIEIYSMMKSYAEKLPNVKVNTITLLGKTGTGKSSIASSMARKVVDRGYSAQFMSAYEFNSLMLRIHTSPIIDRAELMDKVMTCDFLVIDDLGTEPILKNVTLEYLLLVLEERLIKGLSTIITTNLDLNGIHDRYGERIYSRLSDKVHSKILPIIGDDLRT